MKTYRVKHILVRHLYEAQDLLKKLNSGSNFDDLAKKFSECPSASNSGDLGVLKSGQAVEEFEEESLKLKINEITTKPIRTKFGYHLIKRIA
jgi:peptidyl-prolyl cis-trans isomerase C